MRNARHTRGRRRQWPARTLALTVVTALALAPGASSDPLTPPPSAATAVLARVNAVAAAARGGYGDGSEGDDGHRRSGATGSGHSPTPSTPTPTPTTPKPTTPTPTPTTPKPTPTPTPTPTTPKPSPTPTPTAPYSIPTPTRRFLAGGATPSTQTAPTPGPVISPPAAATPAAAIPVPAPAITVPVPATPAAITPAPGPSPLPPTAITPIPAPTGVAGSGRSRRRYAGPRPGRTAAQSLSRTAPRAATTVTGRGVLGSGLAVAPGDPVLITGATALTDQTATRSAPLTRGGLTDARRAQPANSNLPAGSAAHHVPLVPALIGNLVPLPVPDWSKPVILALLLICLLLAVRAWRSARRAHGLESQRTELAADLDSMQAALVPAIPSRLGTLGVSVAYRPADGPAAGGDFYDAFALDGGRVAVIVGDVSGHGRHALARAAHMHYTLRAYVETGLDPRASLKLAGRVLGIEGDGLFTTVAIAIYDPVAATLTYATAGHPAPIVLGDQVTRPECGAASPALGWGLATGLRQTKLPFPAGSRACFFSDGVTEARTPDGLLGRERLAELFEDAGAAASADTLLERVRASAGAVSDDMAACVIAASDGVPVSDHRVEELEVDPDQLATGQGERFLSDCGVDIADIGPTLEHAREVAAELGAAILRVQQTGTEATVTVDGATSLVLATPSPVAAAGPDSGQWAGRALPLRG